jgi:nicotinate-nucleotide--dimethylbenzimidazole phosphoribosyltransferase
VLAERDDSAGIVTEYPRPVPLIGDTSTAAERRRSPDAWAFEPDVVSAVEDVMSGRRDIRRFRPDEVDDAVLRQLLEAAHAAPSVGHSQPWRFVVVRDHSVRASAAQLADRSRIKQAEQLDAESGRQLLALQLDGIREAPIGVVVGCDRRTAHEGVLGRATMPDADMWSCACAIQNLWLSARARGLGVGWVTLFEPAELAALVGFPNGIEPLGWLCVGYPDERPPSPGLERRGWSRRIPLDDLIAVNSWASAGEVPAPVSRLAPPIPSPTLIRDRHDSILSPPDGLGLLGQQLDRIERALGPGTIPTDGTLIVSIGDHPVADLGVSAYRRTVTGHLLRATQAAESLGARTAQQCGLGFRWFDAGCATGDLIRTDALPADDVERLIRLGQSMGTTLAAGGLVALGEIGIGNTTIAAALAAALLDLPADRVVGLGAASDSTIVAAKQRIVERALERVGARDATGLLAGLGGPEIAHLTGVILGVASAGGMVVLDGFVTSIAALVADRISPGIADHLIAGQHSNERVHGAVLQRLGLEALLHMRLRAGEGVGAAHASRMLLDAAAARAATARTTNRPCTQGVSDLV